VTNWPSLGSRRWPRLGRSSWPSTGVVGGCGGVLGGATVVRTGCSSSGRHPGRRRRGFVEGQPSGRHQIALTVVSSTDYARKRPLAAPCGATLSIFGRVMLYIGVYLYQVGRPPGRLASTTAGRRASTTAGSTTAGPPGRRHPNRRLAGRHPGIAEEKGQTPPTPTGLHRHAKWWPRWRGARAVPVDPPRIDSLSVAAADSWSGIVGRWNPPWKTNL
jgi:hypothetical protein